MDETKTNSVTLPSGAVAVLKAVLTAGDFIDASDTPEGKEFTKVQLSKRIMDMLVVSVNGATEDIPNALRSLPLGDYIAISKEVAKLIQGDFTPAKNPQT